MPRSLVIVESPTKAKTLAKFLPEEYQILASYGHIRDLPSRRLGIKIKDNFQPEYEYLEDKEKVIKKILQVAKKVKRVILATDPDREGEAIAYHLDYLLNEKLTKKPQIVRITFHEITKPAIEAALKNPGEINLNLFNAQQARRLLDRLVGYKLSPILWYKVRRGLSAGRVQSVVVRLVYEKEKEIAAFKPQEYWLIRGDFDKDRVSLPDFELVKIDNHKVKIENQKKLKEILDQMQKSFYSVKAIKEKKVVYHSQPPLITSTLQQLASTNYGFAAGRTMRAAQSLYEKGLITYHRTDSYNLSQLALREIRKFIKKEYGDKYVPSQPRRYKAKSKLVQEAHEAIRPTNVYLKPSDSKITSLSRDEAKVYDLIWRRTLISQMTDWLAKKMDVFIEGKVAKHSFLLKRQGFKTLFAGWKTLALTSKEDKELEFLEKIKEGDAVKLKKLDSEQKFSQPPKRYTDASLIKKLEEMGIGRPSTYAPILQKIQERRYVEKEDKKFKLTNLGKGVTEFLLRYFPKIMDYQFTAKMEAELDEIAQGKYSWLDLLTKFWRWFGPLVEEVKKIADRVKIEVEKINEKCPKCGADLVIRIGRFGKFISCSNYPQCDYTREYVQKTEFKCPECGGEVIIRRTKKGRKYYACSNYPKCKWMSWRKPQK